jgi:hypothetical protein
MKNVAYAAEAFRHYLSTELFDIYDPVESTRGLTMQVLSGPLGSVPILNEGVTTHLFNYNKRSSDGTYYENLEIFVDDIGDYNKWILCSVNNHVFSGTILDTPKPGNEIENHLPLDRGAGERYSRLPNPVIPKLDAFNLKDLSTILPDNNVKIISKDGKMLPLHNIKVQPDNSTVDSVSGHVYMLIPYAHFLNSGTVSSGNFDDFFMTVDNEKRSFSRIVDTADGTGFYTSSDGFMTFADGMFINSAVQLPLDKEVMQYTTYNTLVTEARKVDIILSNVYDGDDTLVHIDKSITNTRCFSINDCDIFLCDREQLSEGKGLCINNEIWTRCTQLTHSDFLIPNSILDRYKALLGTTELTMVIYLYPGIVSSTIIDSKHKIPELYEHSDADIVDFLKGDHVDTLEYDFWTIESLRDSYFKFVQPGVRRLSDLSVDGFKVEQSNIQALWDKFTLHDFIESMGYYVFNKVVYKDRFFLTADDIDYVNGNIIISRPAGYLDKEVKYIIREIGTNIIFTHTSVMENNVDYTLYSENIINDFNIPAQCHILVDVGILDPQQEYVVDVIELKASHVTFVPPSIDSATERLIIRKHRNFNVFKLQSNKFGIYKWEYVSDPSNIIEFIQINDISYILFTETFWCKTYAVSFGDGFDEIDATFGDIKQGLNINEIVTDYYEDGDLIRTIKRDDYADNVIGKFELQGVDYKEPWFASMQSGIWNNDALWDMDALWDEDTDELVNAYIHDIGVPVEATDIVVRTKLKATHVGGTAFLNDVEFTRSSSLPLTFISDDTEVDYDVIYNTIDELWNIVDNTDTSATVFVSNSKLGPYTPEGFPGSGETIELEESVGFRLPTPDYKMLDAHSKGWIHNNILCISNDDTSIAICAYRAMEVFDTWTLPNGAEVNNAVIREQDSLAFVCEKDTGIVHVLSIDENNLFTFKHSINLAPANIMNITCVADSENIILELESPVADKVAYLYKYIFANEFVESTFELVQEIESINGAGRHHFISDHMTGNTFVYTLEGNNYDLHVGYLDYVWNESVSTFELTDVKHYGFTNIQDIVISDNTVYVFNNGNRLQRINWFRHVGFNHNKEYTSLSGPTENDISSIAPCGSNTLICGTTDDDVIILKIHEDVVEQIRLLGVPSHGIINAHWIRNGYREADIIIDDDSGGHSSAILSWDIDIDETPPVPVHKLLTSNIPHPVCFYINGVTIPPVHTVLHVDLHPYLMYDYVNSYHYTLCGIKISYAYMQDFDYTDESIPTMLNNDTVINTDGTDRNIDTDFSTNNFDQQTHDTKVIGYVNDPIDTDDSNDILKYIAPVKTFDWINDTIEWTDVPFRVYKNYMVNTFKIGDTTTVANWNLSYDNSLYIPLSADVLIPEVDID